MKKWLLLILVVFNLSFTIQTDGYEGIYLYYSKSPKGEIVDYQMHLNSDQTFVFTSYVFNGMNEYRSSGKGSWKVENKTIHFNTTASDLDENHTLNFTGTTARVIKKSPRDKSDKMVRTTLAFYKSEIKIIQNLKLFVKE